METIKQSYYNENNQDEYTLHYFNVPHPLKSRMKELVNGPYQYKKVFIHNSSSHHNTTTPYEKSIVEHLYVLEMATVCGLEQLKIEERNAFETSTYPLGEF